MIVVESTQQFASGYQYGAMMMMFVMIIEGDEPHHRIWINERACCLMERQLLGSYLNRMFKQQTRLSMETITYLC